MFTFQIFNKIQIQIKSQPIVFELCKALFNQNQMYQISLSNYCLQFGNKIDSSSLNLNLQTLYFTFQAGDSLQVSQNNLITDKLNVHGLIPLNVKLKVSSVHQTIDVRVWNYTPHFQIVSLQFCLQDLLKEDVMSLILVSNCLKIIISHIQISNQIQKLRHVSQVKGENDSQINFTTKNKRIQSAFHSKYLNGHIQYSYQHLNSIRQNLNNQNERQSNNSGQLRLSQKQLSLNPNPQSKTKLVSLNAKLPSKKIKQQNGKKTKQKKQKKNSKNSIQKINNQLFSCKTRGTNIVKHKITVQLNKFNGPQFKTKQQRQKHQQKRLGKSYLNTQGNKPTRNKQYYSNFKQIR